MGTKALATLDKDNGPLIRRIVSKMKTKEEADHSLLYVVAVAILDDQVMPAQYLSERIESQDVQSLLRRVIVRPLDDFSRHFPAEMPSRIQITLDDGRVLI